LESKENIEAIVCSVKIIIFVIVLQRSRFAFIMLNLPINIKQHACKLYMSG